MKTTETPNLLKDAFDKVKELNLPLEDYLKVIGIITDYGGAVRKETTTQAMEIIGRI